MFQRALPLLFAGFGLCAPLHHGGHGTHGSAAPSAALQALHFTEAQQTSIHQVFAAHHGALSAKGSAAHDAYRALLQATADPATDEAQLRVLHEAAGAAGFAVVQEVHGLIREIDPLLTPEQRAQTKELHALLHAHLQQFVSGQH